MSILARFFKPRTGSLSKEEFDLMGLLRASPSEILSGRDLLVANNLASRGLLRKVAQARFALTEKGSVEYHARR